jgi:phenylacetate-coenzyme A ligase PaaK-like adenylate-forming protein
MRKTMRIRLLSGASVLVCLLSSGTAGSQTAAVVEQHLRDQYNSKILLLRNFYTAGSRELQPPAIGRYMEWYR